MINEDGHQDVASAIRQCKIITEDAMQILQKLQTMSPEDSLPTWWTNKLAVASNSMNKMRDYLLVPSVSEELDEDAKMAKQSDDNLKSMMKKMRDAEKKDPKLPSTQFMIKRIGKEMKKRGLKEMNELDENSAVKALKKQADVSNPTDKKFFQKAAELLKKKDFVALGQHLYDYDTAPSEFAMSAIRDKDRASFKKMYGDQKGYFRTMKPKGLKEMNESKSSSGYDLYHKDFSSAMQHAYGFAKKKYGITIDPKEIDDKVATGPRKPSKGKVNKYRLKGDKGTVQIQVTNLDNKRFELNMYKEEVKMNESLKLDEAVLAGRDYKYDGKGPIKISKKMYAKVKRDSKSMIKGKPYMMALDPKTQATVLAPVQFEELDATVESVVEALSAGDNVREQRRGMSPAAKARRDALRDMGSRGKGDEDEVKATDADREKADRNIINKIKKAADVKGNYEIKFDKGPSKKITSKMASLILKKLDKMKPADKLKFQKQAEKSYADFLRAVKDMTK